MNKFAVYAEQYREMVLAENGFSTYDEAAQWAAIEFGLGNWEVREYPDPAARAAALKDLLALHDALMGAGLSRDAADEASALAYQLKHRQ